MSNEDPQTHVLVKGEIARVLANLCKELKNGVLYPDGVNITHAAAGISNNPDGSFVKWETFESGQARLVPRGDKGNGHSEIEGTPDWVLEVLSDSSVDKDTRLLRLAYHRAGIPEYWIVDARGETLDFQILVRRKKAYTAATQKDGWQKSLVFEREFRLTRERTRMNLWEYTLQVRPLSKGRSA